MASIQTLQELVQAELAHKENLFKLLGTFKGSRSAGTKTNITSIVRGLCTNNQKILRSAQQCLEEMQQDDDIEPLKNFANDTVLWFDHNFVVFEKFLTCLSNDQLTADSSCEATLLHCKCYIRVIDSITALIRNPFVVSKLAEAKARSQKLLRDFESARNQSDLDNISFDHVRSLSGHNVSCFFTVDQIVKRTANADLRMGSRRVELLLLNLDRSPGGQQRAFNSLAILGVASRVQPRSVVYPPFRVNELSMQLAPGSLTFSALAADVNKSFAISGDDHLLEKWFRSLTEIFPTSEVPLTSSSISLHGLGINTLQISDHSESSSPIESGAEEPVTSPNSHNSLQIMKKSLSDDGIQPEIKQQSLKVVQASYGRDSITTEYDFVDLKVSSRPQGPEEAGAAESPEQEESNSPSDSLDCFDIITTLPTKKPQQEVAKQEVAIPATKKPEHKREIVQNKMATLSMPDLSAPKPPVSMYINATGSAIDVNQFGKNYNPTFTAEPKQRRKSLFSIFKKKKTSDEKGAGAKAKSQTTAESKPDSGRDVSAENVRVDVSVDVSDDVPPRKPEIPTHSTDKPRFRPELQIEIPEISAFDANMSQPSSALSTSNRTLPSPFAMPSSTSTYFFKPYLNNSSCTLPKSATEEKEDKEEITLAIPSDLKELINSDSTIDYYMSPVSSTALKVSKWKPACAKWELMTANENVFVKIVNHGMMRNWMLVFKEEYDAKYNEVIDKPLLILEIDEKTNVRQSSALDIEINAVNAITNQKNVIMIRCVSGNLAKDISGSLSDVVDLRGQRALTQTSHFESNMTLTSSLMSKPSASSTISSIYTQLDGAKQEQDQSGDMLLLDRMTVRVHRQRESYEHIHQPSSWETMSMYSLSISHSSGQGKGYYHFELSCKPGNNDKSRDLSWSFDDDKLLSQMERIGKAGMLVRATESDMYMLECKGRKEFQRLVDLF